MKKKKITKPAALETAVAAAKTAQKTEKKKTTTEKAAAAVVADKVTKDREVKYIYPANATAEQKKKFRHEVRRKLASYIKKMAALQASELPEDLELLEKIYSEFEAYEKTVLKGEQEIPSLKEEAAPNKKEPVAKTKKPKAKAKSEYEEDPDPKPEPELPEPPKDPDATLEVKSKKRKKK